MLAVSTINTDQSERRAPVRGHRLPAYTSNYIINGNHAPATLCVLTELSSQRAGGAIVAHMSVHGAYDREWFKPSYDGLQAIWDTAVYEREPHTAVVASTVGKYLGVPLRARVPTMRAVTLIGTHLPYKGGKAVARAALGAYVDAVLAQNRIPMVVGDLNCSAAEAEEFLPDLVPLFTAAHGPTTAKGGYRDNVLVPGDVFETQALRVDRACPAFTHHPLYAEQFFVDIE